MSKNGYRRCLVEMLRAGVFVLVILSGCVQSYKAPDLPASELVVIVAGTPELAIMSVDEHPVSFLRGIGHKQVIVLPGEHAIGVQHSKNGYTAEGTLSVDAKIGRRYVLKSASKGYHVEFWLEEALEKTPII